MNTAQRVIKYCAVAFAVLLVCAIFSGLIIALTTLGYVLSDNNERPGVTEEIAVIDDYGDVSERNLTSLYIDTSVTNLWLGQGDEFMIEADEDVITVQRGGTALYVKEKDFHLFGDWGTRGKELKITLPKDWGEFETVRVKSGAGKVNISDLKARNFEFEQGAGKAELTNLTVSERAQVDGGAGYLAVRESVLNNFDLDMGAGKVEVVAQLTGRSEIDAGVGKLDLKLQGEAEDYRLAIKKGLGSITVNGEKKGDGSTWGSGKTLVEIDGGVGAIEIVTE